MRNFLWAQQKCEMLKYVSISSTIVIITHMKFGSIFINVIIIHRLEGKVCYDETLAEKNKKRKIPQMGIESLYFTEKRLSSSISL